MFPARLSFAEEKRIIGRVEVFPSIIGTNFVEVYQYADQFQGTGKLCSEPEHEKRIALANAHDEPALSAVVNARRKGVVEGTLVGKKDEIIAMLHEMGESEKDYEIVDFDGEELEAAKIAVQLVREGKADIPMKGILQTSNFARAILNKETGLIPTGGRRLVSQCGILSMRAASS